ncbi:hypothetical protein HDU98_007152 [Podochytrium sp. JEL0797]|nr:hypothetical protein HDU98_007152 [Podochytrium sp. JEL0797]
MPPFPLQLAYIEEGDASNAKASPLLSDSIAEKEKGAAPEAPDLPLCDICFCIPNRAKHIDSLTVNCPFACLSCPWIGKRDALALHLSEECAIAQDPDSELPPISDFALDEKWAYTPRNSRRLSAASNTQSIGAAASAAGTPTPTASAVGGGVRGLFFSSGNTSLNANAARRVSNSFSARGLMQEEEGAGQEMEDEESDTGSEAERAMRERERTGSNATPLWEQVQGYVLTPEQSAERARRGQARQQTATAASAAGGRALEEGGSPETSISPFWVRKRFLLGMMLLVLGLVLLAVVGFVVKR